MTQLDVWVHKFATVCSEGTEGCSKGLNFLRSGEYIVVCQDKFPANLQADAKASGGKFKEEALDATPLGAAEQVKEASKPGFVPRCFATRAPL